MASLQWDTLSLTWDQAQFSFRFVNNIPAGKENVWEPLKLGLISGYSLACVASVSVWFRSKERGTRVKDRAKNGVSKRAGRVWGRKEGNPFPSPSPSFIFWLSFHFSRGQNGKSRSSVVFCSETKRKRLLRRLVTPSLVLLWSLGCTT